MTSNRPYFLRALYEWILDNGMTPHILVDAAPGNNELPEQYIEDGKIILNIYPDSVKDLDMGNEWITFHARFGGQSRQVRVNVDSVRAIYAKENGMGMAFSAEEPAAATSTTDKISHKKPQLKVVE